jgi:hypothetical protein
MNVMSDENLNDVLLLVCANLGIGILALMPMSFEHLESAIANREVQEREGVLAELVHCAKSLRGPKPSQDQRERISLLISKLNHIGRLEVAFKVLPAFQASSSSIFVISAIIGSTGSNEPSVFAMIGVASACLIATIVIVACLISMGLQARPTEGDED